MGWSPKCKCHYPERDQRCAEYPCKAVALAQELAAEERCKKHRYLAGRRNVR